jgi:SAM-dependent methyltransferase
MTTADPDLPELLDLDYGGYEADLPLYEDLARACDGPVLELGAGTGRVALRLARAGHEVWGIDIDEASLARARCKAGAEALQLVQGDIRDFDLGRTFELVFAAFGTFHHLLTPADQLACLRCVERHLAPGGRFVCDLLPLLAANWEPGASTPLLHDWTRPLPRTGELVSKLRAVRIDRANQLQHEEHHYDRLLPGGSVHRTVARVDLRFTSRYEMEGLLEQAGLRLEQLYGGYDLSPFEDESESMITFATKVAR